MDPVKTHRRYRSERRRQQAAATRAAIVEAAGTLFVELGYSRTTMEAIASQAGVATITVYSTFRTKRALLADLIAAAVSGDRAERPVYEQEEALAVIREPDQRRQIEMFTDGMGRILERVSPLFEVADHAAAAAPEIAELREQVLRGRLHGMRVFVRGLAAHGPLREGVNEKEAAQTVWAVTAPQLFRLLVRDLGWSRERWAAWATKTLSAALLPEPEVA